MQERASEREEREDCAANAALRQPSKILRLRADGKIRPPDFSLGRRLAHVLGLFIAQLDSDQTATPQLCATGVNPIDLRTSLFVFILFYDILMPYAVRTSFYFLCALLYVNTQISLYKKEKRMNGKYFWFFIR